MENGGIYLVTGRFGAGKGTFMTMQAAQMWAYTAQNLILAKTEPELVLPKTLEFQPSVLYDDYAGYIRWLRELTEKYATEEEREESLITIIANQTFFELPYEYWSPDKFISVLKTIIDTYDDPREALRDQFHNAFVILDEVDIIADSSKGASKIMQLFKDHLVKNVRKWHTWIYVAAQNERYINRRFTDFANFWVQTHHVTAKPHRTAAKDIFQYAIKDINTGRVKRYRYNGAPYFSLFDTEEAITMKPGGRKK